MKLRTIIAALLLTGASFAIPVSANAAAITTTPTPHFRFTVKRLIPMSAPRMGVVEFSGTYRCTGIDTSEDLFFQFGLGQTRRGTTVSTTDEQFQSATTCDGRPHPFHTNGFNPFGGEFRPGLATAGVQVAAWDTEGNRVTESTQKTVLLFYCRGRS
jgi:hypothetical protein